MLRIAFLFNDGDRRSPMPSPRTRGEEASSADMSGNDEIVMSLYCLHGSLNKVHILPNLALLIRSQPGRHSRRHSRCAPPPLSSPQAGEGAGARPWPAPRQNTDCVCRRFASESFLSFFPFVIAGHSRSWNGVVSLAYAGNPCRSNARTALPPALAGVASAWTTGTGVRRTPFCERLCPVVTISDRDVA
jgi:hypothetical protein